MTANEFCQFASEWIRNERPDWHVTSVPMADGGEGSLEALLPYLHQPRWKTVQTVDALHRPLSGKYIVSGNTAFIELANASGLSAIELDKRSIMTANTFGTGLMIKDAITENVSEIVLFLGGSATVDGGTGIMQALGARFYDQNGHQLPSDINALPLVAKIALNDFFWPDSLHFKIIHDVLNPLLGTQGAAQVYGPQKGAKPEEVILLDESMKKLIQILHIKGWGTQPDKPGAGAAGGVLLCLHELTSEIMYGAQYFINLTDLESKIRQSDLVITAEGKFDQQSTMGKITGVILRMAQNHLKTIYVICGSASGVSLPTKNIISFESLSDNKSESFLDPGKFIALALQRIK